MVQGPCSRQMRIASSWPRPLLYRVQHAKNDNRVDAFRVDDGIVRAHDHPARAGHTAGPVEAGMREHGAVRRNAGARRVRLPGGVGRGRRNRGARQDRETRVHLPEGTPVAVSGGEQVADSDAVRATLDRTRANYADIVCFTAAAPASTKWSAARTGRRTASRCPSAGMTNCSTCCRRASSPFTGSGITGNQVDKARERGIPVHSVSA